MDKNLKIGLLLQIPNALIVMSLLVGYIILKIDWLTILNNLPIIIVATVWILINLASIFYIIAGFSKKHQ